MKLELYVFVVIGSILPDIFRAQRWFRTPANAMAKSLPIRWWVALGAVVIAISLGVVVAILLAPSTPLLAITVGYSAPSLLEQMIKTTTNNINTETKERNATDAILGGAPPPRKYATLLDLWRI